MQPATTKLYRDAEGVVTDVAGNVWTHFVVDEFAMQESGTCADCGAETFSGWLCLDGGDEVCMECASIEDGA